MNKSLRRPSSSRSAVTTSERHPDAPAFSVVIPVYNEEGILSASTTDLVRKLRRSSKLGDDTFEIILSANGCVDRTVDIARDLMDEIPELRLIESPEPNYGLALRRGIQAARGDLVVCDEIDLCDVDFYERALYRLREEGFGGVSGNAETTDLLEQTRRDSAVRFARGDVVLLAVDVELFDGVVNNGMPLSCSV